jgi:hypothetical protein
MSKTVRSASWNESSLAEHEVLLVAPEEVVAYLDAHADLAMIVPTVCAQARKEFGEKAELALLHC